MGSVIAELHPKLPRFVVNAPIRSRDLVRAIPGSSFRAKEREWWVPATWAAAKQLRLAFGQELDWGDAANSLLWEMRAHEEYAESLREKTLDPAVDTDGHPDLFPFQRTGVAWLLARGSGLVGDEMGVGKGHPVGTLIPTPGGFRAVETLRPGDYVFGRDGLPTRVTGVFPRGRQPVAEVRCGDVVETVDLAHLWALVDRNGRERTVDTAALLDHNHQGNALSIPMCAPVQYPPRELPLPGYTLGALLANGHLRHSVQLTTPDAEVVARVRADGYDVRPRKCSPIQWGVLGVQDALRRVGLWGKLSREKFIPEEYLTADLLTRRALLAGLLDGDGSVRRKNGQALFHTMSPGLRDGVVALVRSLGGTARCSTAKRDGCIKVSIALPENPFLLPRKAELWRPARRYGRVIREVVRVGYADTVCIAVDAADHLYLTGQYVVTHNTPVGVVAARDFCAQSAPVSRALIVCPKTKRLDWLEECQKWWPGGHHAALDGTPAARRKVIAAWLAEPQSGALVASWEDIKAHSRLSGYGSVSMTDAEKTPKELNAVEWCAVVADEAHRAKDPKAKQTRALWALGDAATHRIALTGTPVANNVTDFWALLRFVAPDEWAGRSKFVDRYVSLSYNIWGGSTVEGLNPETRPEFEELSDRWWIRRTKKLVHPQLPEKVLERRWVEMAPAQKKAYAALRDEMVADIKGGQLMVFSPLTLAGRLNQMALATAQLDEEGNVTLSEPSPKLDAMMEILEDLGGAPMAVLGASRKLLDLAAIRLEKKGIPFVTVLGGMKAQAVHEAKRMFNAGEVQVILISLGAGAEGLSLSRGSVEVYLDRSWSQVKNTQGDDRMHGYGRGDRDADRLTIIEILTRGSVEEGRIELLEKKDVQLQEVARDQERLMAVIGYGK